MEYPWMKRCPKLKKIHKTNLMDFARKMIHGKGDWANMVWSDEKGWKLDGPEGWTPFWHDLRKKSTISSKWHKGGFEMTVWGSFNPHDKASLTFVSGRMGSEKYLEGLSNHYVRYLDNRSGGNGIFMKDNTRCHVSRPKMAYLRAHNIPFLSGQLLPWCKSGRELMGEHGSKGLSEWEAVWNHWGPSGESNGGLDQYRGFYASRIVQFLSKLNFSSHYDSSFQNQELIFSRKVLLLIFEGVPRRFWTAFSTFPFENWLFLSCGAINWNEFFTVYSMCHSLNSM